MNSKSVHCLQCVFSKKSYQVKRVHFGNLSTLISTGPNLHISNSRWLCISKSEICILRTNVRSFFGLVGIAMVRKLQKKMSNTCDPILFPAKLSFGAWTKVLHRVRDFNDDVIFWIQAQDSLWRHFVMSNGFRSWLYSSGFSFWHIAIIALPKSPSFYITLRVWA